MRSKLNTSEKKLRKFAVTAMTTKGETRLKAERNFISLKLLLIARSRPKWSMVFKPKSIKHPV